MLAIRQGSRTLSCLLPAARKFIPAAALSVAPVPDQDLIDPVKVTVTGAAGNISYALVFQIARGLMFGMDQPVILSLLEVPEVAPKLQGLKLELMDSGFPLLAGIETTDDPDVAFKNTDYALLVGAKPRGPGMERSDLLKDNGGIFSVQGKALNKVANRDVKVVVVGNPANTNCMIASSWAPDLSPRNFTALTRLDHNRGLAQLAEKVECKVTDIERFAIWGNHSPTMYPDITSAQINGKWAKDVIGDDAWYENEYIPRVGKRGAEIIKHRGSSSAASAASAAVDHMRDWFFGTGENWTSMAVMSDGSYGIGKGICYSFPVVTSGGDWNIIQNIPISEFSEKKMNETLKELQEEKEAVAEMLP